MAADLWGVLLGAGIASLVPLVTLRQTDRRWRLERRIDNWQNERARLEAMYAEIMDNMSDALRSADYPSILTSKISVYASKEFRDLYFNQLGKNERDEIKLKHLYLKMAVAANRHIAEIDKKIEGALS